jgi:hypothetical protein
MVAKPVALEQWPFVSCSLMSCFLHRLSHHHQNKYLTGPAVGDVWFAGGLSTSQAIHAYSASGGDPLWVHKTPNRLMGTFPTNDQGRCATATRRLHLYQPALAATVVVGATWRAPCSPRPYI